MLDFIFAVYQWFGFDFGKKKLFMFICSVLDFIFPVYQWFGFGFGKKLFMFIYSKKANSNLSLDLTIKR